MDQFIMKKLPYYSLKFLTLKIFADFVGQKKVTKIFSREIFSSSLGVAGSSTAKNLSVKIIFVFEQNLAKTLNIYPSEILGYTVAAYYM